MKDITFLYVKDVTKSDATFGVVTNATGNTYTIFTGDRSTTVKTLLQFERGSAVELTSQGATMLSKIVTGHGVEGYMEGRIRVDGKNYIVSDYVKVYGANYKREYESMSMSQIVNNENITQVVLYSDKALSSGGVVRVIVVTMK